MFTKLGQTCFFCDVATLDENNIRQCSGYPSNGLVHVYPPIQQGVVLLFASFYALETGHKSWCDVLLKTLATSYVITNDLFVLSCS